MPTERQRRQAERRRLRRQLQRRAEREARRRRFALIASIVGTLAIIGLVIGLLVATSGNGSGNKAAGSTSPTPTTSSASTSASTSPAPTYPCSWTKAGTAAKQASLPATTRPPKTGKVTVSVQTTQGPMTFTLNRAAAPCTVASFVSLVQQHYYDSTPCHRLVTQGIYVLQCGDPTGSGSGGPGYSVPDEATGNESYPAGTIAMARTQSAHSGGSQFFIVYKDSPNLKQNLGSLQYTVFGTVSKGLSVVEEVANAGSDNSNATGDGKPKLPIKLTKLQVAK